MTSAQELIARLGLEQHPEGGWFRETWRAEAAAGERASGTLIYFLLEAGQKSHWHTVDAAEIWLWHGGNPLQLSISDPANPAVEHHRLGPDVAGGDLPHYVIRPGDWQAAEPLPGEHDYTLVSCVVSPGFDFAGFTLAPPGWHPEA
ncbi:cupin domain-containing protein [Aurantiacibacter sp. MUD11]|uniref:cupin domain-containing protein n=1 Tax=Aurantiacibacter sp. MUD11 TaxID=3003265 RepID=UPI0022AA44E0|nr:cupin domain-containing protein [Aurantiacibacter sp. MUD11]WAT19372.1 cupin domain-containing protein [Aurantiacibacter sp. MUD11]